MSILPQLIANSIIAGAIYTMMALGFNLIYRTTKFFNLAHGALTVVGGYGVFLFYKTLGWNLYLSVILAILIAGFLGYGFDKLIFKTLRKRKSSQMVLLVASLGILTVVQSLIAIAFSSQFQTLADNSVEQKIYTIYGAAITQTQIIIFISGIIIAALLGIFLKKTMFGKSVTAISDSEEVAKIVGIHTNKIIGWIFFIGSAIAGFAGILIGFDTGLEPTMGMGLLLKGVIASIIGGVGNLYGGVAGAFLLGFVENFGVWQFSGEWKDAIAFAVLILFLIFRPNGIFGKTK